ncbi:MAG: D-aminoacyl-tRNA deacylase [Planctomycetota bacterium]
MRACVQRVTSAHVTVDQQVVGAIDHGLVVLLGVAEGDDAGDAVFMAEKIVHLRIFNDEAGKMNRSLIDVAGGVLAISQFTLMGDARKGRRPAFIAAAEPQRANELYEHFVQQVGERGVSVATGVFQASMQVSLVNDGPVTLLLDSRKLF